MLRIGLTGGIGAGKSTVSARWKHLGGILIDADHIAREVVEPGTDGLKELVAEFGNEILGEQGALNRPKLGSLVFSDQAKLARLNAITHPRIGARTAELLASAGAEDIVIQDIPLLIENSMTPHFSAVAVVDTPAAIRLQRLVELRGMNPSDAQARIDAQASDEQRYAAADILLPNIGSQDELEALATEIWENRLVPWARNIAAGVPAAAPDEQQSTRWQHMSAAERLAATKRHINRMAAAVAGAGVVKNDDGAEPEAVADAAGPQCDIETADFAAVAERLLGAGFYPSDGESQIFIGADPLLRPRVIVGAAR